MNITNAVYNRMCEPVSKCAVLHLECSEIGAFTFGIRHMSAKQITTIWTDKRPKEKQKHVADLGASGL